MYIRRPKKLKKNRCQYEDTARSYTGDERRRDDEEMTKRREIGEIACKSDKLPFSRSYH
jgi:hypothetical protein